MNMNPEQMHRILEAALMVAGRPLTPADLVKLFDENNQPTVKEVREALQTIATYYAERGIELREVASGYLFQAKTDLSPWLSRLWEERAPRYSRAVLETLALIAYRQPITRAEIEEIRGVAVSTHIIKSLQEREWIKVVGYRDVPGKPALYATTKTFLDHLSLKSLDELPALSALVDLESQEEKLQVQLELTAAPDTTNEAQEIESTATTPYEDSDNLDIEEEEEFDSADIETEEDEMLSPEEDFAEDDSSKAFSESE